MSEQDIREIWSSIHDLRAEAAATSAAVQTGLARIEALLGERCEARMSRITSMEGRQADAERRIQRLEQLRAQILVIAALGSMVGGAAVAWLFRVLG